jgi:hypothetical protein
MTVEFVAKPERSVPPTSITRARATLAACASTRASIR